MFLGVLFALSLVSVLLAGGRLVALAELRPRHVWLIAAALATQVAIISVFPGGDTAAYETVHLASYLLAGAFAWLNRRIPGFALALAGGASNFIVIAANGGVMPASAEALRTAGLSERGDAFQNSALVEDARLAFLGDVFAVPASWPVSNVFSAGDVLIVGGILYGLHVICGSRPARALGRHPVTVHATELVDSGTPTGLVRVRTVPHRGMDPGDLLVDGHNGGVRLEPLPGSGATAGFAVPLRALRDPDTRLALVLPNGSEVSLHPPTGASTRNLTRWTHVVRQPVTFGWDGPKSRKPVRRRITQQQGVSE